MPGFPLEPAAFERWPGAACSPLPAYARRLPEATPLHRVVREHLPAFLAAAREASAYGSGLPALVERELTGYLACGILAHGFARVRCADCGDEKLVAFSCKSRGLCPSCTTRRAHNCAAHLVDHVIPSVPVRQVVFTFPRRIRWHLVRDARLTSEVLAIFLRAVFAFHRRRARAEGALGDCGSVTFVQRFGSSLALNLHFHALVPDGVFTEQGFHELEPPEDEDVEALLRTVATRVLRHLRRRGRLEDTAESIDALGSLQAASIQARLPRPDDPEPPRRVRRAAYLDGFSLHAGIRIHGNDRQGLERLCLYGARGPLSLQRMELLPDGRVSYRMKRPAPDGSTHLVLPPRSRPPGTRSRSQS